MDIQQHISPQPTLDAIKAWWKKNGDSEGKRHYLGGSAMGYHCERFLWYQFRHMVAEDIDGFRYRLFHRGHNEEFTFVKELRGVGVEVHEVDGNGNQFGFKELGGHAGGHMDGAGRGLLEAPKTWHVLEFKTHSAKSFKDVKANGVLESKPQHYAQMQIYMKWSGMTRAYYMAVNKDNDELYAERIRYDADYAAKIEERGKSIITAQNPPDRPYGRCDYYLCKWCPARELCWPEAKTSTTPAVPVACLSCRQCMHATPEMDGDARWSCAKHKKDLTFEEQGQACDDMLFIPSLIQFAKPTDSMQDDQGNDAIVYETEGGDSWLHGQNPTSNQYSCHDLYTMPEGLIGCTGMSAAKVMLGVEGKRVIPDVHHRYNHEAALIHCRIPVAGLSAKLKQLLGDPMPAPTLTAECDDWNAAEWESNDMAAFVYPDGMAEIRENIPF